MCSTSAHLTQLVSDEFCFASQHLKSINKVALCLTDMSDVNLKVILLLPGLEFIQILLLECHLLTFEQTSVPIAACADLPAGPQANVSMQANTLGAVHQESAYSSQTGHAGCNKPMQGVHTCRIW